MILNKFVFGIVSLVLHLKTSAKVYFLEEFDEYWTKRWVESAEPGLYKFKWTTGKYYADPYKDRGLQTTEGPGRYAISAMFNESFTNEERPLVLQFTVKHEQDLDCGGGYVKLLPRGFTPKSFNKATPYLIMFGPDICRYGVYKYKVQAIMHRNRTYLENKKTVRCVEDHYTHLYTLILRPNNSYEIKIDNVRQAYTDLEDDYLPEKTVWDHSVKMPEDWDMNPEIDDPEQPRPPRKIPDPNSKKPDDWDEAAQGPWKTMKIDNPEYKDFVPRKIPNPRYKGMWYPPKKRNINYREDRNLYRFQDVAGVGIDIWQNKPGTLIDNILVTDDPDFAEKHSEDVWAVTRDGEREMERVDRGTRSVQDEL